jgi:hypothetical protein
LRATQTAMTSRKYPVNGKRNCVGSLKTIETWKNLRFGRKYRLIWSLLRSFEGGSDRCWSLWGSAEPSKSIRLAVDLRRE